MSYTLWLALPDYMLLLGVHPLIEQSKKTAAHFSILETLNNSTLGINILLYGSYNKGLSKSVVERAFFIIDSANDRNRNVVKRRRSFDIFVEREEVCSFVKLFLQTAFGKCYVTGDRIFLRSARMWEMRVKFLAVLSNYDSRQKCLDVLIDVAIACYIAALTNINIYTGLKNTATSITETAATNTATLGIESAAQVVGNAVAGAAISAIVDVAISSAMIYVAKKQKDDGRISEEEFSIRIKKTVCESSCKFVGGTTGSILGQALIPVPIVGAFVGGFCGSLIGAGIGKGITYGVFDRKGKKTSVSQNEKKDQIQTIREIYGRRIRGYIPKVVIYNEKANEFQDKNFPKTIKNYLTTSVDSQQNARNGEPLKTNEAITVKPYINRWKRKAISPDNSNTQQSLATEKQLLVLSRWRRQSKSPEPDPSSKIKPDIDEEQGNSLNHTLLRDNSGDYYLSDNLVAPTPHSSFDSNNVDPDRVRRASYKDRLSPNQLLSHMKSTVSRSRSLNDKDDSKSNTEQLLNESREQLRKESLAINSPETSTSDIPGLFQRLSFKSLKDSILNMSTSPNNQSSKENLTDPDYMTDEAANSDEPKSSISRLRSFHSSIKGRNRDKIKLSNIQKMTLFNSSVDAEGNVYDSKSNTIEVPGNGNVNMNKESDLPTNSEEKSEFLSGFTNRIFSFTSTNRAKSKVLVTDEVSASENSNKTVQSKRHDTVEGECLAETTENFTKPSSFNFSLSSSVSDDSSAASSPCTSSGNENSVKFSEREFDWWNRKLRNRFESCSASDDRKGNEEENKSEASQDNTSASNEADQPKNSNDNNNNKSPTSTSKKDKKLFSTLRNLAKKVR